MIIIYLIYYAYIKKFNPQHWNTSFISRKIYSIVHSNRHSYYSYQVSFVHWFFFIQFFPWFFHSSFGWRHSSSIRAKRLCAKSIWFGFRRGPGLKSVKKFPDLGYTPENLISKKPYFSGICG